MIGQIEAEDAARVLRENDDAVYLDVRSPEEFSAGHPAGALNVPIGFLDPSRRLSPNVDFERVVQTAVPKEKKIIVGCLSGRRSMQAAEILERLGYADVTNLTGGFGGGPDASGRPVRGWKDANLPIETDAPGRSYDDLRQKV